MLVSRASLSLSRGQRLQQQQLESCCQKHYTAINVARRHIQNGGYSEITNPSSKLKRQNIFTKIARRSCQQTPLICSLGKVFSQGHFREPEALTNNKIFLQNEEHFENLNQIRNGGMFRCGSRRANAAECSHPVLMENPLGNFQNIFWKTSVRSFQCGPCPHGPVAASVSKEVDEKELKPKEFSEIPGPKPWPIVGNTVQLIMHKDYDPTHIERVWTSLFQQYGPIIKMDFLGFPSVVSTLNPDDLETVLKSTMDNPIRAAFQSLKLIRDRAPGNYFNKKAGLLPENGEEWWRLRSRVQGPLLRPRNVAMYLPKVDRATLALMDRIDLLQEECGRVPDDFLEDLYKWALECVGLVALDKELGCLQPNLPEDSQQMQMIKHINDVFSALNETEMGPKIWKLYRTSGYRKLEAAQAAFVEIADKSIQEAAESLQAAQDSKDPNRTLTVMETFLSTEGLSKSDVTTMILDMLLAGVDTTSHTIAFTLYLLAKNPECQSKLQEEIDRVMGDATAITPNHIAQMIYMNYVLRESLRLYPLAVGNSRVLTEDIVMSGYRVPKGSLAFGFNMIMCREEKLFKTADKFIPERWARDRPYGAIHPYASLPFSHGKRMCIGKRIAEQEIYTFLVRALQKYRVTFESPLEMQVKSQLVLKPDIPLAFKFHPRN